MRFRQNCDSLKDEIDVGVAEAAERTRLGKFFPKALLCGESAHIQTMKLAVESLFESLHQNALRRVSRSEQDCGTDWF